MAGLIVNMETYIQSSLFQAGLPNGREVDCRWWRLVFLVLFLSILIFKTRINDVGRQSAGAWDVAIWILAMILDCTTSCGVWQLKSCPRFKKNRRAGAPPWSSICDQSQASAIPPPLCSMQCREVKQPWPSPCRNDLPGDILVRDCCARKNCPAAIYSLCDLLDQASVSFGTDKAQWNSIHWQDHPKRNSRIHNKLNCAKRVLLTTTIIDPECNFTGYSSCFRQAHEPTGKGHQLPCLDVVLGDFPVAHVVICSLILIFNLLHDMNPHVEISYLSSTWKEKSIYIVTLGPASESGWYSASVVRSHRCERRKTTKRCSAISRGTDCLWATSSRSCSSGFAAPLDLMQKKIILRIAPYISNTGHSVCLSRCGQVHRSTLEIALSSKVCHL